jgi:Ca-activated chloride channel homolog
MYENIDVPACHAQATVILDAVVREVSEMRGVAVPPRVLPLVLCVIIALGVVVAGRQQPFKSGARTVAVYATVTDSAGRLVPDLSRDDFEIYDNGRPQPLTLFASDSQPITIVVMLDRSGSMKANFRLVEDAAVEFVRRLLPADKARIGSFAVRIQLDPLDFTGDQEEMIRILRSELQPDGPTPLWNAVNVGMNALRRQEGRRVVLVFTDGVDSPMNFSTHNISLKDAMKRATEEDVMVYAIGLESYVPFGGRRAPLPGGPMGGLRRQTAWITQKPDDGLPKIAGETGGGYFELATTDDLSATFTRVADELHRQYALGFEPSKLDGKSHKLEVRLKKPGMTARARRSYIAAPE